MILGIFIDSYMVCFQKLVNISSLFAELGMTGSLKPLSASAWNSFKTRAALSGRKQSALYRLRRAPADPREIMAQSSASYPFIPFPPPDRECVIIL